MKNISKRGGFTLREILLVVCTLLVMCALALNIHASSTNTTTTACIAPALGHAGPDAIPIVGMTNPKLNIDVIGATANYKQIGLATTGKNDRGFDRIFPMYSASTVIYSNQTASAEVSCSRYNSIGNSFVSGIVGNKSAAAPGLINYG